MRSSQQSSLSSRVHVKFSDDKKELLCAVGVLSDRFYVSNSIRKHIII